VAVAEVRDPVPPAPERRRRKRSAGSSMGPKRGAKRASRKLFSNENQFEKLSGGGFYARSACATGQGCMCVWTLCARPPWLCEEGENEVHI
jgi:hypothetical protein